MALISLIQATAMLMDTSYDDIILMFHTSYHRLLLTFRLQSFRFARLRVALLLSTMVPTELTPQLRTRLPLVSPAKIPLSRPLEPRLGPHQTATKVTRCDLYYDCELQSLLWQESWFASCFTITKWLWLRTRILTTVTGVNCHLHNICRAQTTRTFKIWVCHPKSYQNCSLARRSA